MIAEKPAGDIIKSSDMNVYSSNSKVAVKSIEGSSVNKYTFKKCTNWSDNSFQNVITFLVKLYKLHRIIYEERKEKIQNKGSNFKI